MLYEGKISPVNRKKMWPSMVAIFSINRRFSGGKKQQQFVK